MKGLTKEEVNDRISSGLVNNESITYSRTIKAIIFDNILTIFNIINVVLFIFVLSTGSIKNAGFLTVIIINTIIAIYQEIKAKNIIDKLRINNQSKVNVIRDCKEIKINKEEIVLDDIIVLKSGDEVLVDSLIVKDYCEVDESIITGESNSIRKEKDDKLLSGTIILSGRCTAKVISINKDNYTNKLVKEASIIQDRSSYLMNNINKILKLITILIIPTGILLFITQYFFSEQGYNEAILSSVAGIIGMIPEGLVLLTSIALTVGVITLAKKKVIVQRLNGIENLACIDVLCLDKTGTITDNTLKVIDYINIDNDYYNNIIAHLCDKKLNNTDIALYNYFKKNKDIEIEERKLFSSVNKYSSIKVNKDIYKLGAFEYITNDKINKYLKYIKDYIEKGYRILSLSKNNKVVSFIVLKDNIRKNAKEVMNYFKKQNVLVKIISGDNPITVSNILKQIEISDYDKYISGLDLPDDYDKLKEIVNDYKIFGRVTPKQKQLIVKALKETKNVGFVGDGVNDILALKESNCGITLSGGVEAARSSSEIILTTDDFGILPEIVNQGRKVVNNIERVSSMYLVKTIFSFILSILSIIISYRYPFYPIQLSLISGVCVGVPSFFLALESNYNKVSKSFIKKVFRNALPSAICVFINIFLIIMICEIFNIDFEKSRIIIVSLTGLINLRLLYNISKPLSQLRKILLISSFIIFFELLILFPNFFLIGKYNIISIIFIIVIYYFDRYIIDFLEEIYDNIIIRGRRYE